MGLFNRKPKQQTSVRYLDICDLAEYNELQTRVLAFETCVNLIAGAVAKCDFKTFKNHKEVKEAEWYLLNVEPNPNQNSSEFFHKLIHKLYENGDALVVDNGSRSKNEFLAVADSFQLEEPLAFREQRYVGVVLNGTTMNKSYRESEVLHFKLNENNIKPVLDGIMSAHERLLNTAKAYYGFSNGVHLKDHVDMIANDNEETNWEKEYMAVINNMVKPFLNSDKAVLPEFDGHEYTVMDLSGKGTDSRDIKEITNDIFEFTAKSLNIPPVLVQGNVAGVEDIVKWFLTFCIDPLLDLLQEEFNRKRYGAELMRSGSYVRIDSSTIMHYDAFSMSASIEKLIGSGFETINEVRDAAGLQRSDDPAADKLFITKNFAEVGTQVTAKGGE